MQQSTFGKLIWGHEPPLWVIAALSGVSISGTLILTALGAYRFATHDRASALTTTLDTAILVGALLSATGTAILVMAGLIRHRLDQADLASQLRLSAQRESALATASHDLRNPVGAIAIGAQLLALEADHTNNPALTELAGNISDAARRVDLLIADLLDATRADAGALRLTPERLELRGIVADAIADVALSQSDRAALVQLEMGDDTVVGDRARLRAAVRNLLENALRYAEAPYRVRSAARTGGIELHIEDGGPGIPPDEREQILLRFQRGSTAGAQAGTGLGLWLVATIASVHGGRLVVGDSPLGGADFVLSLPQLM